VPRRRKICTRKHFYGIQALRGSETSKAKIIRSVRYSKMRIQKTILENSLHHGEMKGERMSNIVRMI